MKEIIIRGLSFWMAFVLIMMSFAGEVKASGLQKQTVQAETESEGNSESFQEEFPEDVKKEQIINVAEEINVCINDTCFIDAKTNGDGQLTYKSLHPEIAEVDEMGQITAKALGEAVVVINASETDTFYAGEAQLIVNVGKRDWNISIDDMELTYGDSPKPLVFENLTGNTPVFEIKNTKIAKIDADGNITPVKIGETSVLISVRGNEEYNDFSCEVKVKVRTSLSTPVLLEATGQGDKITLRWEKVEGADGYYIYRKNSEGEYKKIHTIKDSDILEYVIEDVKKNQKYTYKIRGYSDGGKNYSWRSNAKTGICMTAPKLELKRSGNTVIVNWTKIPGASGYYISRKTKKSNEWEVVSKISSGSTVTWTDKSPKHGWTNRYCVNAYYSTSTGEMSETKTVYFLKRPSVKIVSRKTTSMTVEWSRNSIANGYELQYADNCLFYNPKSVLVEENTEISRKIRFLSKTKTYYVRIRAYRAYTSNTYYSDWAYSSNVTQTKNATYKLQKYKKKTFELKDLAEQYVGGYDTVQGGCTDGKYAYYAMNNRKVEKCRIVKVRLSDMKVVKVSPILKIAHGNDMTYNPNTKKIVVTHTKVNMMRLSIINPSTLKREKSFDVTIPKDMPGLEEKDYERIIGFSGIEYNADRNQYILYLKNTRDCLILDENFEPVTYVALSYKTSALKQGVDATKDFILTYHSGTTNFFRVYTWEGKYLTRINVKKGYELENIYHVGGQYYATFYYSYYKKGKLQRDNYVYKISGF